MVTLGEMITKERTKRKLTKRALAKEIGFTPMFISDLESGRRVPTNGESLSRLAEYFSIDLDELKQTAALSKAAEAIPADDEGEIVRAKLTLARSIVSSKLTMKQLREIQKAME